MAVEYRDLREFIELVEKLVNLGELREQPSTLRPGR